MTCGNQRIAANILLEDSDGPTIIRRSTTTAKAASRRT